MTELFCLNCNLFVTYYIFNNLIQIIFYIIIYVVFILKFVFQKYITDFNSTVVF